MYAPKKGFTGRIILAMGVLLAATSIALAQPSSGQPGQPTPAQPADDTIKPETLEKFLKDCLEEPKPVGTSPADKQRFVLERKKSLDGWDWTLRPVISLSGDNTKVIITTFLYGLPELKNSSSEAFAALLAANAQTAPAFFGIENDAIVYRVALENKGLTPRKFRFELDQFIESYGKNHKLWNMDFWTFPGLKRSFGFTNSIRSVVVFPDGKRAAGSDYSGDIRIWDLDAGTYLILLKGHAKGVLSLAISPDGKTLYSGEEEGIVREWDIASQKEKRKFEGHKHSVWCMALSKDGKRLATGGGCFPDKDGKFVDRDGKPAAEPDLVIRLWDVETGKEIKKFEGHTRVIKSVAFSPDGKHLASASDDKSIRIWDIETGKEHKKLEPKGSPESVHYTSEGKLVSGGLPHQEGGMWVYDQNIIVWDVAAGKELVKMGGQNVWGLALSPDGKQALSCGPDRTIRLWDLTTGKQLRLFTGHRGSLSRVTFTPDGKRAVSGGSDNKMRLWALSE